MTDEHTRLLLISNVGRIMKQVLPPNAKISKEARELMQECTSEFIGFVTAEASDRCHKENRRTMNGDDVCWAFKSLGLDNYSETMFIYLYKLREFQMQKAAQGCNNSKASCSTKEDDGATNVGGMDPPTATLDHLIDFGILKKGGM